ncbi:acyltransferase family protein [Aeromonas media]|uniref:acyltransferase family protein n=1 Tax=Aeromonas media TaxID=651 RepID=UPI0011198F7B|nr:acyltransferase family protein [Aeromonas media]
MQRNTYLDYVKGILILLVTIGHAIQFLINQNKGFWSDNFFKFIYIFHMPLFMSLAGYLSYSSINKLPFLSLVWLRIKSYVLPIFAWSLLCKLIILFTNETMSINAFIIGFIKDALNSYWFLWALFGSLVLTAIVHSITKYRTITLLIIFLLLLLLPDISHVPLFKYMFPFFLAGFYLASLDVRYINNNKIFMLTFLTGIVSVICYFWWDDNTYIYVSKMSLTSENIPVIVFRYFASAVFCMFVMGAVFFVKKKTPIKIKYGIEFFGKKSIYVYIIQGYIFSFLLLFSQFWTHSLAFTLEGDIAAIVIGVLVAYLSLIIGDLLSKNNILAEVLFGKSKNNSVAQ